MYSKTCLLQTSMGPAFVFSLYLLVKLTNISYFGIQLWCLMPLDLQLLVQSVPITTKVVSSNPIDGEVYSIQHYVIKFISDLRQVGGFLRVLLSFLHQ